MQDTLEKHTQQAEPIYTPHPCTALFPPMSPEEEADFVADIERNGLREAIIIDQHDRIVDGVHRYRACVKLGINPAFDQRTMTDQEAWALSFSLNFHRRHMSEATRAAISAEARKSANLPLTQAEAARAFNISERTQRSAEAVLDASPDLHRAVKEDKLSVHAAEKITKLPAPRRTDAIDKVKKGDIKGAKTLAKAAASSQVKKMTAKPPSKKAPCASAKPQPFNAVYAPLFGELAQLSDSLVAHPLAPAQAEELITMLRMAIARIERVLNAGKST